MVAINLRGDSENNGVCNLTGGARDENALGLVITGSGSSGHGSRGDLLVDSCELIEGS